MEIRHINQRESADPEERSHSPSDRTADVTAALWLSHGEKPGREWQGSPGPSAPPCWLHNSLSLRQGRR